MFAIAIGTPFDGVSLHGPFADAENAGEWAEQFASDRDWWLVGFYSPAIALQDVDATDNWRRDDYQFPRLLSELFAVVDDDLLRPVAESMDLELSEIIELFTRAEDAWERVKVATT